MKDKPVATAMRKCSFRMIINYKTIQLYFHAIVKYMCKENAYSASRLADVFIRLGKEKKLH